MKGIIIFYINFIGDRLPDDWEETVQALKNQNKDLIDMCKQDGYQLIFTPTVKEASRVEKVDFDKPFPRFVAPHVEIKDDGEDD